VQARLLEPRAIEYLIVRKSSYADQARQEIPDESSCSSRLDPFFRID